MKNNRIPLLGIVLITLLASCGNKTAPKTNEVDAHFERFRDYFVESLWKISPSDAIYAGYHKYDSILIAPSAENREFAIKEYKAQKAVAATPSTNTLLLVILALLLPPLAVYLHEGQINGKFWLNLLLTLLFFIPGVIHALIVVLG